MLKQWLFAALVAGGISATGADYSKELAEIKAGQRTEARASWWGFDKIKCDSMTCRRRWTPASKS